MAGTHQLPIDPVVLQNIKDTIFGIYTDTYLPALVDNNISNTDKYFLQLMYNPVSGNYTIGGGYNLDIIRLIPSEDGEE